MNKLNKKFFVLPIVLISGIIATSVVATGTNVSVQSIYRDKEVLTEKNLELVEKIEKQSSLKSLTAKVAELGFVTPKHISIKGGVADSLSMAVK